mgnify:CR=1 FL=1
MRSESNPDSFVGPIDSIDIIYQLNETTVVRATLSGNKTINSYFKKYDIVYFHSFIHKTTHEDNILRIKWLQKQGIKLIMDLDDYWLPTIDHPIHSLIIQNKIWQRKTQ